ncbi:hypothetical protein [Lysobacter gummosus]|uniref:hypothetical protein n=1 Tax=Lysobacter gummosus TaxID=262324 RepID=UPI00362F0D6A
MSCSRRHRCKTRYATRNRSTKVKRPRRCKQKRRSNSSRTRGNRMRCGLGFNGRDNCVTTWARIALHMEKVKCGELWSLLQRWADSAPQRRYTRHLRNRPPKAGVNKRRRISKSVCKRSRGAAGSRPISRCWGRERYPLRRPPAQPKRPRAMPRSTWRRWASRRQTSRPTVAATSICSMWPTDSLRG